MGGRVCAFLEEEDWNEAAPSDTPSSGASIVIIDYSLYHTGNYTHQQLAQETNPIQCRCLGQLLICMYTSRIEEVRADFEETYERY
jgi:hypothetical protein